MGMASNFREYRVVPDSRYKNNLYCQACRASFPNEEKVWGYRSYEHDDTSGDSTFWGGRKVPAGQCPFCGRTEDSKN